MYAERELAELAERKALLCARIAERRLACVGDALAIAEPISVATRLYRQWQELPPVVRRVGLPAGLVLASFAVRRLGPGKLKTLFRAAPVVLQAIRLVRAGRKAATGPAAPPPVPPPHAQPQTPNSKP